MTDKKILEIEKKKFNFKEHIKQVIIANLAIAFIAFMTIFANSLSDVKIPLTTVMIIDSLIKTVFIIWEGVLIAKLIIEEYQTKTVLLLFSYPLSKKQVIKVKLILITVIILLSMVLSQIFQNVLFFALSKVINSISYHISIQDIVITVFTTITSILMGMIPLYIGMQQKSTIATIISSIIIVSITVSSSSKSGAGLIMVIPVALFIGVIGFVTTMISVNKMLSEDVIV